MTRRPVDLLAAAVVGPRRAVERELRAGRPVRLILGAFNQSAPGWISTDVTPHLLAARVPGAARLLRATGLVGDRYHADQARFRDVLFLDVRRPFPLGDDVADYVYTSHMLEHLSAPDGRHCLAETLRVLKPGGVLRVSVPDLALHVGEFRSDAPEAFLTSLFGYDDHADEPHRHRWSYTESSLRRTLEELGYVNVERHDALRGRTPDLAVFESRPRSLFLEAEKP